MVSRGSVWVTLLLLSLLAAWVPASSAEGENELDLRPVLLVVDVQNAYLPHMAQADKDSAAAPINEAIALFRKSGNPVIVVQHTDPKRGPEPGSEPSQFADWVNVTAGDPHIVKMHPSAFTHTDLDSLLKSMDRNSVFLCGLSAVGCVLATYFGALDRDYMTFMVEGALISHDATYTDVVEDICYSVSIEELATALKLTQ